MGPLTLGRGLISAQPNADQSQFNEDKVVCRELVMPGCDPSALVDLVEEPLNTANTP